MKKAKLLAVLSFAGIAGSLLAGCQPAEPKPEEHVHSYSELHSAVAATCTEAGKKAYYDCTGCDKVFDENKNETTADALKISALGHSMVHYEETESSCIEHGHVEYYECSVCGDKFSDSEGKNKISETEKALAAHSGVKQDGKAPTCTEPGWKEYYQCSECKAYFEDLACTKVIEHIAPWKDEGGAGYLAPVGHDMAHIDGDPATCKEDGYKECYFCEECGKYYEDEAGTKLIGDEAAWEVWIVGAGKLAKEDAQHIAGEKQQINRVEATCTEDGSYDEVVYCTCCGELISSEHKIIEATGHLDVEPIDGLDPTCSAAGYKACYYCNDCKTYFEDQEGTKKIENLDAWRGEGGNGYRAPVAHSVQHVDGLAATCEEAGYKECWQCKDCSAYFEDEACTTPIANYETWKANGGYIAPKGHDTELSVISQVDAGCETAGVKAYYKCESCGKYFSDSKAENEITNLESWKAGDGKIDAKGHAATLTHHDGQAETCCANGFEEYWECPDCGLFFSDNAAANKIGDADALADWKTAAGKILAHDHEYGDLIEEVPCFHETDGMKAHYICGECGGYFDEEKNGCSASDLVIKNKAKSWKDGDYIDLPKIYTSSLVMDVKFTTSGTLKATFYAASWGTRTDYITINSDGTNDQSSWVNSHLLDDGWVRITLNPQTVNKWHDYNPSGEEKFQAKDQFTNFYISGSTGAGLFEIESKAVGHDYGELISGTPETHTSDGVMSHYQCSVCSQLFDADKNKISSTTVNTKHSFAHSTQINFRAECDSIVTFDVNFTTGSTAWFYLFDKDNGDAYRYIGFSVSPDGKVAYENNPSAFDKPTDPNTVYCILLNDGWVRAYIDLSKLTAGASVSGVNFVRTHSNWGDGEGTIMINHDYKYDYAPLTMSTFKIQRIVPVEIKSGNSIRVRLSFTGKTEGNVHLCLQTTGIGDSPIVGFGNFKIINKGDGTVQLGEAYSGVTLERVEDFVYDIVFDLGSLTNHSAATAPEAGVPINGITIYNWLGTTGTICYIPD